MFLPVACLTIFHITHFSLRGKQIAKVEFLASDSGCCWQRVEVKRIQPCYQPTALQAFLSPDKETQRGDIYYSIILDFFLILSRGNRVLMVRSEWVDACDTKSKDSTEMTSRRELQQKLRIQLNRLKPASFQKAAVIQATATLGFAAKSSPHKIMKWGWMDARRVAGYVSLHNVLDQGLCHVVRVSYWLPWILLILQNQV